MATLISVPAGRCTRRGQTKWVDPQPAKGLLQMKLEDDLMRLWWTDRTSGAAEDELIIFPGEATFEKVSQDPSERTHILKFSSSDQKYFFWFQRTSKSTDARARVDINALLQDPYYRPGTADIPAEPITSTRILVPPAQQAEPPNAPLLSHAIPGPPTSSSAAASSSTSASTAAAPRENAPATAPAAAAGGGSAEDMARMLVQWANSGGLSNLSPKEDKTSLRDIISAKNIRALLAKDPSFATRIKETLPKELDLPDRPDDETLVEILTAPQMTEAVGSLENALRSGGLPGSMMRDLGLPESAGTGVGPFLDALQALKKGGQGGSGGDDKMDED